jgi:hypothetical protein
VKVAASSDTSAYLANSAPREHTVRIVELSWYSKYVSIAIPAV